MHVHRCAAILQSTGSGQQAPHRVRRITYRCQSWLLIWTGSVQTQQRRLESLLSMDVKHRAQQVSSEQKTALHGDKLSESNDARADYEARLKAANKENELLRAEVTGAVILTHADMLRCMSTHTPVLDFSRRTLRCS